MITAIRNDNKDLYKDLFARASEILSGFESVQTYEQNQTYWYKDSATNVFKKFEFTKTEEDEKILEFANALTVYGKLYIQIKEKAVDGFVPELGITTLEEYYNWLPELKRDSENKPTVFTKLPLDEAHFEINANTRAITIPNDFKKNGIGVQGDDLAEVVYFIIDRYFDAVDLNNTEIYIEWETPKGKSGAATKAVSEPYLKIIDDENYLGKLIFGWALSEAITKESGTLKFAVRFIQRNEDKKIVYSFNTLTAQVNIHPNLGVDMATAIESADNVNDRLLERIQESEVVGGAKAKTPYFLTNLVNLETDDGTRDIDNHKTGTYTLSAVATADDTGAVSYVWKRSELDVNNKSEDSWVEVLDGYSVELVALTEDELKAFNYKLPADRDYHIKPANEGSVALEAALYNLKDAAVQAELKKIFGIDATDTDEFIPTVYENRALLVVDEYGKYKVEARNRIFNSLTKADSKVVTFRRPDAIKFVDNQTRDKHIIDTDSAVLAPEIVEAVGDLDFQWYKAVEENLMSEKAEIVGGLPAGGKVSYSDEAIRILCPTDPSVYTQQNSNTELGGRPDRYYVTMRLYAPSDAVYLRMAEVNSLSNGEDPVVKGDEELITIADKTHGIDAQGRLYSDRWIHIAGLTDNGWKSWSTGKGEGEYVGYRSHFVWYDAQGNAIDDYSVKIQLANEDNFNALENYQEVEGANLISYTADEPGLYKLAVVRTRNRAPIDGESIEYRVTNAPIAPDFSVGTFDSEKIIPVRDLANGTQTLSIEWDSTVQSDSFTVVWYLSRELKGDEDLAFPAQTIKNAYTSEFNPTEEKYAKIFEDAGEDIEGYYYAVVSNTLNGVTSDFNKKPDVKLMFSVTAS